MSPRKSERGVAAIEALVCRDVGRKTQALIDANARRAGGGGASRWRGATRVGLITGFFVPRGDVAAPETDGPVGTALLAAALAACGVPARIAVDTPCADAVRAAVEAAGGDVTVDEVGVDDRRGHRRRDREPGAGRRQPCRRDRALRPQRRRPAAQHARRRCLAVDGAARRSVPRRHAGRSSAVGDGGNEIGMGKLPAGLIARTVPNGAEIACVTSCDHLVVAGVSNWGAYGLMAALAVAAARLGADASRSS